MNIPLTTVVLSAELLEEKGVPMGKCENGGHSDDVPFVAGYADDDEDEEDELDDDDELDEDDDWEEVDEDDEDDELDDDEEDEDEEVDEGE